MCNGAGALHAFLRPAASPSPAPSLGRERPGALGCYAHLALVPCGWVGVLQAWVTFELGKLKAREGYHRDTQPFK